MATFHIKDLKHQAVRRLEPHRGQVRKLVLLYSGIMAILTLGLNGLNVLLDNQIGTTGGIGGMGLRTVLKTIQSILGYISTFFQPFWTAGFLYALLGAVRGQEPRGRDLLEGFRRWGRIIGGLIFQWMVYLLMTMLVLNIATMVIGFTGLDDRLAAAMAPVLESEAFLNQGVIDPALVSAEALWTAVPPVVGIFLLFLVPAWVWMSYQFRMATYLMMERQIGGKQAHLLSMAMLRGHKRQLLRLDLSFWWYYLLVGLLGLVFNLDTYLIWLGFELPFGNLVWFFGSIFLYCGLLMAVQLWKKPLVDGTYLTFFDGIAHPQGAQE